jgi:hypothetical protein
MIADVNGSVVETGETDNTAIYELIVLPRPDVNEPNETPETATEIALTEGRAVVSGLTIHSDLDVDWFRIDLQRTAVPNETIAIKYKPDEGALIAKLYDASSLLLNSVTGIDGVLGLNLRGLAAGAYRLAISVGLPGEFSTNYSITVDVRASLAASLAPLSGPSSTSPLPSSFEASEGSKPDAALTRDYLSLLSLVRSRQPGMSDTADTQLQSIFEAQITNGSFSVAGPAVEFARRLCAACATYGCRILIGPETFEQASETFEARPIEVLKGVGERRRVGGTGD